MEKILDSINKILVYRQETPGTSENSMKTNDEKLTAIKRYLSSLKHKLEVKFQNYKGVSFEFDESKGASYFPFVLHVSILPPGQQVSDGIYTVICFDTHGKGFVVGCAESVENPKGLQTKKVDPKILNINGGGGATHYENIYVNPKLFFADTIDADELEAHLCESIDLSLSYLNIDSRK